MVKRPVPADKSIVRSDHACFGCGDQNPIGLHLRFAALADGVTAPFTPGIEHQGFESIVHGGIISTVLDEAMAWATAYAGLWAVTGEMRVRFRLPLHVGEPTRATARVRGCRGRIVTTIADLTRVDDLAQIATASATFVKVSSEVEATWRVRYELAPNTSNDETRIDQRCANSAALSEERASPSCDDALNLSAGSN